MKRRSDLSAAEQQLLLLFTRVWFGRVEGLTVRGGQPILPPAQVVWSRKFGTERTARVPDEGTDFDLKEEIVEFFGFLRSLGQVNIKRVDLRYGLPVAAEVDRNLWSQVSDQHG